MCFLQIMNNETVTDSVFKKYVTGKLYIDFHWPYIIMQYLYFILFLNNGRY